MDLETIKAATATVGPWAYIGTTRSDGRPHVVPVHPCWDGDMLYVFGGARSQKAQNLRRDDRFTLHYTVSPETNFDHVIIEGRGRVLTDVEDKRRCWAVMDYPLEQFGGAGGPEDPSIAFLELRPTRAVHLKYMGRDGRDEWVS